MKAEQTELTIFERLLLWRRKHFSERTFILMLSFMVGILTACAALIAERTDS